jgi:hypothetical protein
VVLRYGGAQRLGRLLVARRTQLLFQQRSWNETFCYERGYGGDSQIAELSLVRDVD